MIIVSVESTGHKGTYIESALIFVVYQSEFGYIFLDLTRPKNQGYYITYIGIPRLILKKE